MTFQPFATRLAKHVEKITRGQQHLFVADVSPDDLWERYLDSFPGGSNPIFRERREHDCSCCRQFIRSFGNVVSLRDNKVTSIWDFKAHDPVYQIVIDALNAFVRAAPIRDVFVTPTRRFGMDKNIEIQEEATILTWYHFHAKISESVLVNKIDELASVRGRLRESRHVFERSLTEISIDALDTVLELIAQKSLYRGEEWNDALKAFQKTHKAYARLPEDQRAPFCWLMSIESGSLSRIKNHSIGVLLVDITKGMPLDDAVQRYERIVAPSNYKRPKAIFTKKMVQQAQKTVKELGFEKSLSRRHAQLGDITVNNILWANRDIAKQMAGDIFDELAASVPSTQRNFDKVEEIPVERFMKDVLPTLSEMEVLVENKHLPNLVSLIAPGDKESPSLLKWPNAFSWAYSGNIADSMKQRVKKAGGDVDGDLRFSIQWNDFDDNRDDLDAHCVEPDGNLIYFSKMCSVRTNGRLDVDITSPSGVAVENITWPSRSRMLKGTYLFLVHDYSSRNAQSGFTAEIEFDGHLYSFEHPYPLRQNQKVEVAEVYFDGVNFTLKPLLKTQKSSRDAWGLPTENFHQVTACMYSPNYWDGHPGTGHRHYFFMLKDCKSSETPNGFFNEFLPEVLMSHKKVFEALGAKMKVADSEDQLSGVGFSSTKRASVVVRVKGTFTRVLRILF